MALLLLCALPLAAWRLRRKADSFLAGFCELCFVASVAGFWSLSRIGGEVGDYQVFWLCILGGLGTGGLGAAIASQFRMARLASPGRLSALAGTLLLAALVVTSVRFARWQAEDKDRTTLEVYLALHDYVTSERIQRPLLRHTERTWAEMVGVVLQFVKRSQPVSVQEDLVRVVGEDSKPTGHEDREFLLFDLRQDASIKISSTPALLIRRGRVAVADVRDIAR